MPDNESDFEEPRHDLVLETFQPSWEKRSVAEVTNQIGHAHPVQ
jgi:hypothetical protein